MIKIRIEGHPSEIDKIIQILEIEYNEELDVSGIYELDRKRSRAYIDIQI